MSLRASPLACRRRLAEGAGTTAVNAIPYDPGAERQIVRVRICYNHKTINPGLGLDLAQADDGSRELVATIVFRNEPFSS